MSLSFGQSETLQALLVKERTSYKMFPDGNEKRLWESPAVEGRNPMEEQDSPESDSCTAIKRRKLSHHCGESYLDDAGSCSDDTSEACQQWREKLCAWAYKVVDHFEIRREVVAVTMNYFDRYFHASGTLHHDQDDYSVTLMSCFVLALKLYEFRHIHTPESSSTLETIATMSRGICCVQQLEKKEMQVLSKLKWRVHPPTPQLFLHTFLPLEQIQVQHCHLIQLSDLAHYLIEMSVLDFSFCSYTSSEIALAAIFCAMQSLGKSLHFDELHIELLQYHTGRVQRCIKALAALCKAHTSTSSTTTDKRSKSPNAVTLMSSSPVSVREPPLDRYRVEYENIA
eukprot:Nitzschia sp. Nitz4//scaffold48_size128905//46289//47414//NITZ4_003593-RA/size128905-augustus-gene-0.21-mRNA-1//-1//CDS//3329552961//8607//frame0